MQQANQTQWRSEPQWRSLAELAGAPEYRAFLEAEFPAADDPHGMSRRRWLQLMGASLALAGVSGCRWEEREIRPFAVRPANRVPGVPQHFATALDIGGVAQPLLVTAVDGRPIKIEGNPKHPQSGGATDAIAQATILQLYDPDRDVPLLETTDKGPVARSWEDFTAFAGKHFGDLQKKEGQGLAILSEASSSPTLAAMRAKLLKAFPKARWHEYEAISSDNERAGAKLAFGKPYRTQLALEKAQVIVCLDADLLASHPAAVQYTRAFADGRQVVNGQMSRLYVVESGYSLTGTMADHRLALRSLDIAAFVGALEREVRAVLAGEKSTLGDGKPSAVGRFVQAVAKDLKNRQGECLVAVGSQQPAEVHAAVHRVNAALGNVGKTLHYTADPQPDRPTHVEAITQLTADIATSQVSSLLIVGGNPVYDAPADLKFGELLAKVPTRIRLGHYRDETSLRCNWHLPQVQYLESWGDVRSYDGTYTVVQPLIEPLHGGKSTIELLAILLGDTKVKAQDLVRETFQAVAGKQDWETRWTHALNDGLLPDSAWPAESPALLSKEPGPAVALPSATGDTLEIVFTADPAVYDGRFANNGWLQELPRTLTKLTWDNAAIFNPATAAKLGVSDQTIVRLKYDGRQLELPAFILPGQAAGSVAVALGFGRTAAGKVGGSREDLVEPVGVDVYPLRTSKAMQFAGGLIVEVTGKAYPLAVTQDHFAMDSVGNDARTKRAKTLAQEATLQDYQKDPEFAEHATEHPPLKSLWAEPGYEGHRWGMAIDLSRCTGCNACVVACQAENNVPVVGKSRVLKGREMHWIRIDRYFQGAPEEPSVVHQPVACQQCEMAPCEQVCPVAATVHSKEGLNDMVYNRCVGTRYCANNCPYKVRRFNFFNYHKDMEEPGNEVLKMVYNPEVTVRSRGVMEKCTYCVQRIQAVKIHAKNEQRAIADGEITTACQQACPARAITFGDLNDPQSHVRQAHDGPRAYALLGELNAKPRTAYQARIRNPNPELVIDL